MKKIGSLVLLLGLSCSAIADLKKYCDTIERFRIWAQGSDSYGVWVEFEPNPPACPGGFYVKHSANNKDLIMSFLLAEKAQNNRICLQASTANVSGNRCRLNYVYNP